MAALHRLLCCALLSAAPLPVLAAPEGGAVFWVGAAAPCNFNSLQTAIGAVPDGSFIRLANNQSYDDTNVVISNKSLTVEGGFSDCVGTVSSNRAALVGDPMTLLPVIGVSSGAVARVVILRRLDIRGGRRSGIELSGRVELRLERSVVDGNQASSGGGVRVAGLTPADTLLRVTESLIGNADDPALPGNSASGSGGGLHCVNARVQLRAAAIRNNDAGQSGGGLYTSGCDVETGINTTSFPGLGAVTMLIEANTAVLAGGGIFATGSSDLQLGPATSSAFAIRANQANDGGGIYLNGAGSELIGMGLTLADNRGISRAGGAYVGNGAHLWLRRNSPSLGPLPPPAPEGVVVLTRCGLPVECSEVLFNRAETLTGGAFWVSAASLTLHHTVVSGNFAENGSVLLINAGSSARVENSILYGNDSDGGDVVRVLDGSSFVLNSSTLAGNATGFTLINLFSGNGGNNLNLRNSIIWEPGTTVLAATPADTVAHLCLNAHETASITALTHDPGFVDAAADNYRLLATSANIDACADPFLGVPTDDILGELRPVDLAPVDGTGAFDRGAYELSDLIFEHDFGEPPPF